MSHTKNVIRLLERVGKDYDERVKEWRDAVITKLDDTVAQVCLHFSAFHNFRGRGSLLALLIFDCVIVIHDHKCCKVTKISIHHTNKVTTIGHLSECKLSNLSPPPPPRPAV